MKKLFFIPFLLIVLIISANFIGCSKEYDIIGPSPINSDEVKSIGVKIGAMMIGNNDTVRVDPYAGVIFIDTSSGPVQNRIWRFFDNGETLTGITVTHNYNYTSGTYRVSKTVQGPINSDSTVFYVRVGGGPSSGGVEPVILISSTFQSTYGMYSERVGFAAEYMPSDTTNPFFVIDDSLSFVAQTLSYSNIQVVNGHRYLYVDIMTYDSTWWLYYGGNHSGQPNQWKFANTSSSTYYSGGKVKIMNKGGAWYKIGMTSYDTVGTTGDMGRWAMTRFSLTGTTCTFYFNQKLIAQGNHGGPYVTYKIVGTNNTWQVLPATYVSSTGWCKIEIPRSSFSGNGETRFKYFSAGTYEPNYTLSRFYFTDSDGPHLRIYVLQ